MVADLLSFSRTKTAFRRAWFLAAQAAIAGFGEGTPQQVSRRGKMSEYANFGTVVETCSKKLPLPAVWASVNPLCSAEAISANFGSYPYYKFSGAFWLPLINRAGRRFLPSFANKTFPKGFSTRYSPSTEKNIFLPTLRLHF
jgi:hypothetical protein|nr:putative E3 ubiquitin-protein ligase HERC2 [bacterium]